MASMGGRKEGKGGKGREGKGRDQRKLGSSGRVSLGDRLV
jgi:hypothetical protein